MNHQFQPENAKFRQNSKTYATTSKKLKNAGNETHVRNRNRMTVKTFRHAHMVQFRILWAYADLTKIERKQQKVLRDELKIRKDAGDII